MYSPKFHYTQKLVKDLMAIENAKVIVEMLPLPYDVERKLREQAKIRMAHYSTRIEGNPLAMAEAEQAIFSQKDRRGLAAEQECEIIGMP